MTQGATCDVARVVPRACPRRRGRVSQIAHLRGVRAEEWVNTITHGIGFLLSLAGAIFLLTRGTSEGDFWRMTGCKVFSATLVAVYAASTLSHYTSHPRWRFFFRTLDQAVIYLLIVGTYTPFGLVYLRTGWWLAFLGAMWAAALFGFCSKLFFTHRINSVSIWSYIALGWMPSVAVAQLFGVLGAGALWWMFLGGLCYTIGTVFLLCDGKVRHFHAVWHLLVIIGSTCHFAAIYLFVA